MPRVRGTGATQEEYEEWLGRLEEEEPLPEDFEQFQRLLRGQLNMPDGSRLDMTDSQIARLWETKMGTADYAEHGVKALGTREAWGWQQRYAIVGLPGLWGYQRILEFREAEGW